MNKNDNTCGRWDSLRLALYCNDLNEFHKILRNLQKNEGIKPIELTILTTVEYTTNK